MNYKILLVDDHTLVRKGIKALLLSHYPDWEIQEADDGVQAILACASVKQDIVLMDYDMPKLDGLTAARQILKHSPGVRILMVSMHDGHELEERLQECGVMGIIHKNAGDGEFLHAINRVRQGIKHFPVNSRSEALSVSAVFVRDKRKKTGLLSLTSREAEVFRLLVTGRQPAAIAAALSISVKTLDTHKMSIFRKCGVHSIPELVRFAFMNNAV
jgi:DNA-binding NarL/FixJ family response regulator